MKLRLTPLNIVVSVLLVAFAYQLLSSEKNNIQPLYFILMALTCFIADMIFRRTVTQLKRIWIIELLFIIFAAVIFVLIKR